MGVRQRSPGGGGTQVNVLDGPGGSDRGKVKRKVAEQGGNGCQEGYDMASRIWLQLEADRWTTLLGLLWLVCCGTLLMNKTELWVMLESLLAYTLLSFSVDVAIAAPKRLTSADRATLSNGLVCIAHSLVTVLCIRVGAAPGVKLTIAAGFLTFDLWDKTWKRLFARRGLIPALAEATVLVSSIIAVCKHVPVHPDLLVVVPVAHLFCESLEHVLRLAYLDDSGLVQLAALLQRSTLAGARLMSHAAVLVLHVLSVTRSPVAAPSPWTWAGGVMSALLITLNLLNVAGVVVPYLTAKRLPEEGLMAAGKTQQHKSPASLWYVHGQAYDLTAFVDKHPGGPVALSLGIGRDCTAMFESYHPFTDKHREVLKKYRVAVPESVLAKYCISRTAQKDEFYEVLKTRVAKVLEGKDIVASTWRRSYYVIVLVTVVASYVGYLRGSWLSMFVFGVSSWLLGAMGHDGAHFACCHIPWVNQLCGLGISLIASPLLWYHQHTYGHHSHTNDFDRDPDLHHFTLTRPHERQPHEAIHRLQAYRWYVYLQYGVVAFGEAVWIPIKLILFQTLHGIMNVPHMSAGDVAAGLAHLIGYVGLVWYLPAQQLTGAKAAVFPTIYTLICGILFGLFSQINHLNESSIGSAGKGVSWAVEQVETSANFATHSPFWFMLSNGLNFQIEHHLFPSINHEHLWRIKPVVEETCREFGVRYKSYDSMRSILRETAQYYRSLAD